MKILRVEKKRYVDVEDSNGVYTNNYGNGVLTRTTYAKAFTLDPDGKEVELGYDDIYLRIRCLDCGTTLKIFSSTLGEDFVEIGGIMGTKKMWREIFREVLGEE